MAENKNVTGSDFDLDLVLPAFADAQAKWEKASQVLEKKDKTVAQQSEPEVNWDEQMASLQKEIAHLSAQLENDDQRKTNDVVKKMDLENEVAETRENVVNNDYEELKQFSDLSKEIEHNIHESIRDDEKGQKKADKCIGDCRPDFTTNVQNWTDNPFNRDFRTYEGGVRQLEKPEEPKSLVAGVVLEQLPGKVEEVASDEVDVSTPVMAAVIAMAEEQTSDQVKNDKQETQSEKKKKGFFDWFAKLKEEKKTKEEPAVMEPEEIVEAEKDPTDEDKEKKEEEQRKRQEQEERERLEAEREESQKREQEEAEKKQRLEEEVRVKVEEEMARREAEVKAQAEAEAKAREEERVREEKQILEEERRARIRAEAEARALRAELEKEIRGEKEAAAGKEQTQTEDRREEDNARREDLREAAQAEEDDDVGLTREELILAEQLVRRSKRKRHGAAYGAIMTLLALVVLVALGMVAAWVWFGNLEEQEHEQEVIAQPVAQQKTREDLSLQNMLATSAFTIKYVLTDNDTGVIEQQYRDENVLTSDKSIGKAFLEKDGLLYEIDVTAGAAKQLEGPTALYRTYLVLTPKTVGKLVSRGNSAVHGQLYRTETYENYTAYFTDAALKYVKRNDSNSYFEIRSFEAGAQKDFDILPSGTATSEAKRADNENGAHKQTANVEAMSIELPDNNMVGEVAVGKYLVYD